MGAVANKPDLLTSILRTGRLRPGGSLVPCPGGAVCYPQEVKWGKGCAKDSGARAALPSLRILLCKEVHPHPAHVIVSPKTWELIPQSFPWSGEDSACLS